MARQLYRLELAEAPNDDIVSVPEVKDQLRITGKAEDEFLAGLVSVATEHAETYLGRSLVKRTYVMFLDYWPLSNQEDVMWEGLRTGHSDRVFRGGGVVTLPKPPLISVTHIKTYDDSDTATTFSSSNYYVDAKSKDLPGRIILREGQSWPSVNRVANGIEIKFVAGYGNKSSDIPMAIRTGCMRFITHLNEHRGDEPEMAMKASGAEILWRPKRIARI